MHRLKLLEGMLSRLTPRDRAAAILGDLVESAETNGQLWFWISFGRILMSLAWRRPAAWLGAYAIGATMFALMMTGGPLGNGIGLRVADARELPATIATIVVGIVGSPLWFIAPYSMLRFGFHDRFTRLALWLFVVTNLGMLLSAFPAILIACAGLVLAALLAGLCSQNWRPQILVLGVAVGVGHAASLGIFILLEIILDRHPGWSYGLRWSLVRITGLVALLILTTAFSWMHSLVLRRSEGAAASISPFETY